MLKTLWLVDAVFLLVALGMAVFSSGQDAAGRGMLWFFPLAMAAGLAASWLLDRLGAPKAALGLALVAPLLVGAVFLSLGRSLLSEQREKGGVGYWSDAAQQRLAAAIAKGDTVAMKSALEGADVNAVGREGMTPLTFAIWHNQPMVTWLLQHGANPNQPSPDVLSPLAQATGKTGPAFEMLLAGGADANGPGDHEAPIIFTVIRAQIPSRFDSLVAHGADVQALDAAGRTTLMAAVQERQWTTARRLLALGVDRTIVARDGTSLGALLERLAQAPDTDPEYAAFLADFARTK